MSSFLSASENVARQRSNDLHDLKKIEEEGKSFELAWEGQSLIISGLCCTRKMFPLQ